MSYVKKTKCSLWDERFRYLKNGIIFELSDGHQWDAVDYPVLFSNVLAVTTSGTIVVIEQFRFPVEQRLLMTAGGAVDEGETSEMAGVRELLEETGYRAGSMELLMKGAALHSAANTGRADIYVARNCVRVQEPTLDPVERIADLRVRELTLEEVRQLVASGDASLDISLLAALAVLVARYNSDFRIG